MQIPGVFAAVTCGKPPAACADLRSRRAARTEADGELSQPPRRKPF